MFGGRLAASGTNDVWLLSSWKEHVSKLNEEGLKIVNPNGEIEKIPVRASTHPAEILKNTGYVDLALILVKSPYTKAAAEKAAEIIDPQNGYVLTLQNGLGNRETIFRVINDESKVLQGVTRQGKRKKTF